MIDGISWLLTVAFDALVMLNTVYGDWGGDWV